MKREPPPEPDFAAVLCEDCNQWIPLCDECIDDWPMGVSSWCCRQEHKATAGGRGLRFNWVGPVCTKEKKK